MSEYVEIQAEPTDDPDVMQITTNVQLASGKDVEVYESPDEGEEGSALAQALFEIPGLAGLRLDGTEMFVQREPGVEWPALIADVSDVLRDFFL